MSRSRRTSRDWLAGMLAGVDLISRETNAPTRFDLQAGSIVLPAMKPHSGRVIGIRATDKAAYDKAFAALTELMKSADPAKAPAEIPASFLDWAWSPRKPYSCRRARFRHRLRRQGRGRVGLAVAGSVFW